MNLFIKDLSYPENCNSLGVSANYIKYFAQVHGHNVVKDIIAAQYILLTSVHPIQSDSIKKYRKYKKPIIVGGSGCLSPHAYLQYADFVCVGDCNNVLINLNDKNKLVKLPNVLSKEKENEVIAVDDNFNFNIPPIMDEAGRYNLICGRGCKNKCFFCQTGWSLTYKESDKSIDANLLKQRGFKISYISNDLSQHSFYKKMPVNTDGSYSINHLKKTGLPICREVRLGIEGVSERLRKFANKPITKDDLVNCTIWLNNNKKSVRWFLIAGMPTETENDWQELKESILEWKERSIKGVLELSFTAFCPDPATPFAYFGINSDYYDRFCDFKEWFFTGKGFSNRIKLYQCQQPKSLFEKAQYSMCISSDELKKNGYKSPNFNILYPFKKQCDNIKRRFTKYNGS